MKNNIKILFVNTHFIPDYHFGGVVESGSKIYKYLKRITSDISLATVSKNHEKVYEYLENEEKCYKSLIAYRWGFSFDLILGLWQQVKNSDVVFINGTVTFPTIVAQIYSLVQKKPFIVSLRGAIEPWRMNHKKWKKYYYFKFIVIPLLKKANNIHVTAQQEVDSLKLLGINQYFLVSNGIDLEQYNRLPDKYEFKTIEKDKFVFLFMSRMDKEKGLDILIEAYKKFTNQNKYHNSVLLLVGPDNQNYLNTLNLDFERLNIMYINGIYGDNKIKVIRRSDVVLLPSYNENFGNIIAEAFACERPVITTTETPWKDIESIGCGYYIKPKEDALLNAMNRIYNIDNHQRETMGQIGREYIFENFNWAIKAKEIYTKILELNNA
jgi:glycosyltransferase involved in cell wall biosynthesis